jgi:GNAT superfamily N-acetyltransferase
MGTLSGGLVQAGLPRAPRTHGLCVDVRGRRRMRSTWSSDLALVRRRRWGDAARFDAVRVVDQPDAEIVARLCDEISAFNFAATDIRDGRELFAAIHDQHNELAAGAYGWTWAGTCWIERLLWVRKRDRGQGAGSALLEAVKAEGLRRGCTQLALATHSSQGPEFYRRHGFEAAGEWRTIPAATPTTSCAGDYPNSSQRPSSAPRGLSRFAHRASRRATADPIVDGAG